MVADPKTKPKRRRNHVWVQRDDRLFTVEVKLLDGPMTDAFRKANKKVTRTIALRGDDTLDMLHHAIYRAFDREDPHLYEFQFGGKKMMDRNIRRYVMADCMDDMGFADAFTTPNMQQALQTILGTKNAALALAEIQDNTPHNAEITTIGSLNLQPKDVFFYWFDFGDDWYHRVKIISIKENAPEGKYPAIIGRVGDSPPQYVDWDEEEDMLAQA